MIGAGAEPDHRAGLHVGDDQGALAVFLLIGGEDRKAELGRWNTHIAAGDGVQHDTAGIQHQDLFVQGALLGHANFAGGRRATEGDVDEILAGHEIEGRGAAFRGGQQRQFPVATGDGAEDPPGQARLERLAVFRQKGLEFHVLQFAVLRGIADERVEARKLWHLSAAGDRRKALEGVGRVFG
ncbi:hypothetical protein ABIA14_001864 [Sinorhizobium fredii]